MNWNFLLSRLQRPQNRKARRAGRGRKPVFRLALEALEDRSVPAAVAQTAFDLPAQPLLGENLTFAVTLTNASRTDNGYAPFLDLVLPHQATSDLNFWGASFQGAALPASVHTDPASGDQNVIIALPLDHLAPGGSVSVSVNA